MADRDNFSTDTLFDNIPPAFNEIESSALDDFLNSDPDDVTIIEEEDVKPKQKINPQQVKPKQQLKETKKVGEEDENLDEEEEKKNYIDTLLSKDENDDESSEDNNDEDELENNDDNLDSSINKYQELANEFVDLGIINLEEDEELTIENGEDLVQRLQQDHKKSAAITLEKFLSRFGEDYKEAFDAIFVNGLNPRDYFSASAQIEDLEELDLDSVDNQKKIFRQHYKGLGLDEDRIEAKLQKALDYGDLEDDSKDFHRVLVQKQKDQKEQMLAQQQELNKKKAQQKQYYSQAVSQILRDKLSTKEFDGIPLDERFANDTFDFLTQDKYQTPDGQTLTEFDRYILDLKKPENFDKRVKLAMLAQMLETDPTLSKIQKKAITKESRKIFGRVIKHTDKQKTPQQKRIEDDRITSFI